jgi:hypothetical protein
MSRTTLYAFMCLLLVAILAGAFLGAQPIYLAVGFIGEIILGATAHLSTMIERYGIPRADAQARA